MVSWFPSQIWFLCDFCPYLLWGLPHGHFWATSYIFPRPQTPWRQCFPHLSVFPRRIRYSAKATGVPPVVCGWRAKPAEKDCATGSSEEGPCGTTPTGSACPRPGLCSTSPLVSPAVRVPGLELGGGWKIVGGGCTHSREHSPDTRRHDFASGCLKGHLVAGEGGE